MKTKLIIYALLLALYIALANAINALPMLTIIVLSLIIYVFFPLTISFHFSKGFKNIGEAVREARKAKLIRQAKISRVVYAIGIVAFLYCMTQSVILVNLDILGIKF